MMNGRCNSFCTLSVLWEILERKRVSAGHQLEKKNLSASRGLELLVRAKGSFPANQFFFFVLWPSAIHSPRKCNSHDFWYESPYSGHHNPDHQFLHGNIVRVKLRNIVIFLFRYRRSDYTKPGGSHIQLWEIMVNYRLKT